MKGRKRKESNSPDYLFSISNKEDMIFWTKGSTQQYLSQSTQLIQSVGIAKKGGDGIITTPPSVTNQVLGRYGISAAAFSKRTSDFYHFVKMKNFTNFEFVLSGSLSLKTDKGIFKVQAGETLIVPNGNSGQLRILSDNTNIFWINVSPKCAISKAIGKDVSVKTLSSFHALTSILKLYQDEIYNSNDLQILEDYASAFYHLLIRDLQARTNSSKLDRLTRVIGEIRKNPASAQSTGAVAKKMRMTVYDLDKLSLAHFGERFAKLVLSIKMKEAMQLLLSGQSCSDVANRVGFKSQFSFSHSFKAFYNKNPSEVK